MDTPSPALYCKKHWTWLGDDLIVEAAQAPEMCCRTRASSACGPEGPLRAGAYPPALALKETRARANAMSCLRMRKRRVGE